MFLHEAAKIIRSKNAGPRMFTFDIMFSDRTKFELTRRRLPDHAGTIANLYGVEVEDVEIIDYPPAKAIKIVIPRKVTSGDRNDSDVYGAQQHAPLLGLKL